MAKDTMEAPERPTKRIVRFGAFEVDLRAGELFKQGTKIKLQQQPFRVLALLLEQPGEVVTREELRQAIWPAGTFVEFDIGVDAAIHKLRSALGDSAEHPLLVETLPRRGYRFIGGIDTGGTTESPALPAAVAPSRRRSLVWAGGIVVAVALVVRLLGPSTGSRIHAIAVLPFENLSGDSAQEYFAEGMTEALVTELGGTAGLTVISHASAMHYKGTRKTLPEIGRELDVDAVVDGAVLRVGNRVRVTAQLVEASTDRHLWAETYERNLQDVLGLQDDLTRAIAEAVQLRLLSTPQSAIASPRTRSMDPEVYDLYLRGRAEWNEWTEQGTRNSIAYFQRAVERDPTYAPAWSGLSDAYDHLGMFNRLAPKVAWFKAKAAAERAVQLDETLSEGHASLGSVLLHEWAWSAGETELQRAIALNPNNAQAHQTYGYLLSAMGQADAGVREMRRALELDPLSPNKHNSLAATLYRAGRYEDALRYFRDVPDPDLNSEGRHRRLAAIYERQGKLGDAMAEWVTALRLGGKHEVAAAVERDYRTSGYAVAKRALLRGDLHASQHQARAARPGPPAYNIAANYALLGERDSTFAWLERAYRERRGVLMFLIVDDRFEAVRSDPRFQDLARRMGLPATTVRH